METLAEVFREQAEAEEWLERKHPWVAILRNWVLLVLVIMLFVSFVIWGINIHIDRKSADMTATAMAALEAERQAIAEEEAAELARVQASEDYIKAQEATALARAFYGIRNFDEKYGYSSSDFETYARCIFNRAEATGSSLESVVSQSGQFLGYSDNNPILDRYQRMAREFVDQWHSEQTKPCDKSYQFAELTESGIWLKADFNADGYARRWRA